MKHPRRLFGFFEGAGMKSWRYNLALLCISQLLVLCGFAAMIPFIPLVFKNDLQVTDQGELALYIALFNFAGALGYAASCPVWGKLADKFGVKPMLLRGTFVTALIFPLMAYTRNPWVLIVLRLISSACAGTTAASQTMIARTAPYERQGLAQGILSTAYWGGMVLGNVAGGFIIHWFGYKMIFWTCGILYFIGGISILFTEESKVPPQVPVPAPAEVKRKNKLSEWLALFPREVWALQFLFLLSGIMRNYDPPYLAIKVEAITGALEAARRTGIVSAVVCGGAILSGAATGYLADRLKPHRLLIPSLLLSALALVGEGFSRDLFMLTAAQTAMFVMAGAIQPLLQKQLTQTTPLEHRGIAFGFSSMFSSGGGMLAALISGWVFGRWAVDWVYYSCAIIYVAAIPFFLFFIPSKKFHTGFMR